MVKQSIPSFFLLTTSLLLADVYVTNPAGSDDPDTIYGALVQVENNPSLNPIYINVTNPFLDNGSAEVGGFVQNITMINNTSGAATITVLPTFPTDKGLVFAGDVFFGRNILFQLKTLGVDGAGGNTLTLDSGAVLGVEGTTWSADTPASSFIAASASFPNSPYSKVIGEFNPNGSNGDPTLFIFQVVTTGSNIGKLAIVPTSNVTFQKDFTGVNGAIGFGDPSVTAVDIVLSGSFNIGPSGRLDLFTGTLKLEGALPTNSNNVNLSSATTLTLDSTGAGTFGTIAGSGNLVHSGTGTVSGIIDLTANATLSGPFSLLNNQYISANEVSSTNQITSTISSSGATSYIEATTSIALHDVQVDFTSSGAFNITGGTPLNPIPITLDGELDISVTPGATASVTIAGRINAGGWTGDIYVGGATITINPYFTSQINGSFLETGALIVDSEGGFTLTLVDISSFSGDLSVMSNLTLESGLGSGGEVSIGGATLIANQDNSATISALTGLSGSSGGSFQLIGPGSVAGATLTVSGPSSFAGTTTISDGAAGGGHLILQDSYSSSSVTLSGSSILEFTAASKTYAFTISGTGLTQLICSSGNTTLTGSLTAFFGEVVTSGGTLTVTTQANSIASIDTTGGRFILDAGGTFIFHPIISGTGVFEIASGVITIDDPTQLQSGGSFQVDSGATMMISGTSGPVTISADIEGEGSLIISGSDSNVVTLDGDISDFTGSISIGISSIAVPGNVSTASLFSASSFTIISDSTLTLTDSSNVNRSQSITNNGTINFDISGGSTVTYSGVISGNGGITQEGVGSTLVFTTDQTFTGATTLTSGTLTIQDGFASSSITLAASTTLNLNSDGGSESYASIISGSGDLNTSGTTTLTANNSSYTGEATVSSGSLTLTNGFGASSIALARNDLIFSPTANQTYGATITGLAAGVGVEAATLTLSASGSSVLVTLSGDISGFLGTVTITNGILQIQQAFGAASIAIASGQGFSFDNSSPLTYAGSISGGGNISVDGSSSVTLSGANTFTGSTTVNSGTLTVTGSSYASSSIEIAPGAVFVYNSSANYSFQTLSGSGGTFTKQNSSTVAVTNDFSSFEGTVSVESGTFSITQTEDATEFVAQEIELAAGTNLKIIVGEQSSDTISWEGNLSFPGAGAVATFTKDVNGSYGDGTLVLLGTVSGADASSATVINGGTLQIGDATTQVAYPGEITINNGNIYIYDVTNANDRDNTINNGTGIIYDVVAGISTTFSGSIEDIPGPPIKSGSFTKTGGGTLEFTNASGQAFTGPITVNGGTLATEYEINSSSVVVNSTSPTTSNAFFHITSSTTQTFSFNGAGNGGTIQITSSSGTVTYSGNLSSSIALLIDGSANTTLTGTNTHTGTTTFSSSGTVTISNGGSLSSGSNLIITSGTTVINANCTIKDLNLTGGTLQVGLGDTLTISGSGFTGASGSTLSFAGASSTLLFDGDTDSEYEGTISGAGDFIHTGEGSLELSGILTGFTGDFTVSDGELILSGTLQDVGIVVNGGSAIISGTGLDALTLTVSSGSCQVSSDTSTTFVGSISGGSADFLGALPGAGTLSLSGGDATMIGDSSQAIAVSLTSSNSTLTFSSNSNVVLATTVSGSVGTIEKEGTGILTITTNSPFSGDFIVTAGTVALNASYSDCDFQVEEQGTLKGTGTVHNLVNYGTVAPGNSIGTITVLGNYIQATGSTLEIEFNSAGSIDLLSISGSATIQPQTIVSLFPESGNYLDDAEYFFIETDLGVSGRFFQVTTNNKSNLSGKSIRMIYTPTKVGISFYSATDSILTNNGINTTLLPMHAFLQETIATVYAREFETIQRGSILSKGCSQDPKGEIFIYGDQTGSFGNVNSSSGIVPSHYQIYSTLCGIDRVYENASLGVFVDYTSGQIDGGEGAIDTNNYMVGGRGSVFIPNIFLLEGIFGYSWNDGFLQQAEMSASRKGTMYIGQLNIYTPFCIGPVQLTPYGGIYGGKIGFHTTEENVGLDTTTVDAQTITYCNADVGLQLAYQIHINRATIAPYCGALYQWQITNNAPAVRSFYNTDQAEFFTFMGDTKGSCWMIDLGLSIEWRGIEWYLEGSRTFAPQQTDTYTFHFGLQGRF